MVKRLALGAVVVVIGLIGLCAYLAYEPDIPRSLLEAKYALPPSKFVTLAGGTRVHYRDRGYREAPVLLLLHGSDSSLFDWEPWAKILSTPDPANAKYKLDLDLQGGSYVIVELRATQRVDPKKALADIMKRLSALRGEVHVVLSEASSEPPPDIEKARAEFMRTALMHAGMYRVITVDLPGHGLTGATPSGDYSEAGMAKFVEAFADKLGLKRFALGGNSMGGGVAARFAEQHPDRVTHLVIVDGYAAGMAVGSRLPLVWRLARTPVVNRILLKLTPRFVVEEGLGKAVAKKTILTGDFVDRFWDFVRLEGTRPATLTRFNLVQDTYVRDHMGRLTMPTLILWGADDRLLPVAGAHVWAKAIPNSKLVVYPATGHMPMEELPEKSAADVRAFLLAGSAKD